MTKSCERGGRDRSRVEAQVKFNGWELEGPGGCWFALSPVDVTDQDGADWW